jgi:hypothetical protein
MSQRDVQGAFAGASRRTCESVRERAQERNGAGTFKVLDPGVKIRRRATGSAFRIFDFLL